jgi:hypothetical protein
MVYAFGLVVLGIVIYGIVKAASGTNYAEMTEEEFEAEARRSSHLGPAIMAAQKLIDPGHKVEYVQEQNEKIEADSAESGDRPVSGNLPNKSKFTAPR